MKKQANHVSEMQTGADGKRRLPVLRPVSDELSYELRRQRVLYGPSQKDPALRRAMPKHRGECPQVRPCPYFCKHNAWVVSGLDQAGRRWVGTLEKPTDMPSTQVQPTLDHNCTLDWAEAAHERESVTPQMIADVLGISDRQARRYNAEGMAALPAPMRDRLEGDDERAYEWRERQ